MEKELLDTNEQHLERYIWIASLRIALNSISWIALFHGGGTKDIYSFWPIFVIIYLSGNYVSGDQTDAICLSSSFPELITKR